MRAAVVLAALATTLFTVGCAGYKQGTLSHPGLKTVAIGEVRNASDVPNLETYLRQHLAEQFTADGTLRLTTVEEADCVIVAEVAGYSVDGIAETRVPSTRAEQRINRSTAFRADLEVNWRLDLADAADPLLKPRRTVGRGVYPERFDYALAREAGLKQATHDAARQIVSAITEGW